MSPAGVLYILRTSYGVVAVNTLRVTHRKSPLIGSLCGCLFVRFTIWILLKDKFSGWETTDIVVFVDAPTQVSKRFVKTNNHG